MKTPLDILNLARSYMASRVVLTAAELDLFTLLDGNGASARDLAAARGWDERALTRVLDCVVTFGLVAKRDGRYCLTERGAFLSSRHRASVLPMALHLSGIWDNWSGLSDCVREGANPRRKPIVDTVSERDRRAFIGAMHVAARRTASEIVAAYDTRPFTRLLDVGGGSGAYSIAFLKANPRLRAVLFDLEGVMPIAREYVAAQHLTERVTFVPGDFYRDELPAGCDLALLSAIIHQNSPQQNVELYGKVHRALEPGGVLLIRDFVMDEERTRPPGGALFALNMLVNTPAGDTYTLREVREGLEEAGFTGAKLVRSGDEMDALVEAART